MLDYCNYSNLVIKCILDYFIKVYKEMIFLSDNKKETIYNAEYQSLDDLVYYTATQVAEMVGEPVTTIYSWVKDDCFGDLLNLNKVNGRRVFTKQDIENIRYISELRARNYSIQQTRDYISKQGFKFGEYDSGLVDPKDPLGFEALAIKLAQKQNEELQEFKNSLVAEMGKFMHAMMQEQRNYLQGVSDELAISLENKIEKMEKLTTNMLDNSKKNLEDISESIDKNIDNQLKNQIESISKIYEQENTELSNKIESITKSYEKNNEITTETLKEVNRQLKEIKETAYVTAEEIKKQKQEPPNRWRKWFTGVK